MERLASPFVLQRQADAEGREMEQYAAKLCNVAFDVCIQQGDEG